MRNAYLSLVSLLETTEKTEEANATEAKNPTVEAVISELLPEPRSKALSIALMEEIENLSKDLLAASSVSRLLSIPLELRRQILEY